MSEGCEVLAAVVVEGLAYMGQNPAAGAYICAWSFTTGVGPAFVCPVVGGATCVGRFAATPGGKELMTQALIKGCEVAVYCGEKGTEIVLVKGKAQIDEVRKQARTAENQIKALNTTDGILWLMRYLRRY